MTISTPRSQLSGQRPIRSFGVLSRPKTSPCRGSFCIGPAFVSAAGSSGIDGEAHIGAATEIQGKYVDQITVAGGGITIRFGNQANQVLAGQTLGLAPALSANDDVTWVCGRRTVPAGVTAVAGATATTSEGLLDKYLPTTCRTGGAGAED